MLKYFSCLLLLSVICGCSTLGPQTINDDSQIEIPEAELSELKDFPFYSRLSLYDILSLKKSLKENTEDAYKLSANQILNLLGKPLIIKKTHDLEIWQFRGKCTLNIVWNKNNPKPPTPKNNSEETLESVPKDYNYKITWLEALTSNQNSINAPSCLATLIFSN